MAPTVHVTMRHRTDGKEGPGDFHRIDNLRLRFPDEHPSEQGQIIDIVTVTLNGVQDFVIGHAVGFAGDKVIGTVCRSRVHDTRAARSFNVFGRNDNGRAFVARV